jgi:hypothetical protein
VVNIGGIGETTLPISQRNRAAGLPCGMVGNDVMKQTADGLYRGTLSCKDNTLLTVGFSLRTSNRISMPSPAGTTLDRLSSGGRVGSLLQVRVAACINRLTQLIVL